MIIAGCPTKARKPAPTPVKMPGKVTLSTMDPAKSPSVVKDVIEKQKDRETFNVVRDGTNVYAVVTRGKMPYKNFDVKFKDIEKIDLGNGRSQVRIQVIFTVPNVFPGQNKMNKTGTGAGSGPSSGTVNRPGARQRLTPQMRAQIKEKLGTKGQYYPVAVAKINISAVPETFSYNVLHEKDFPADMMDQVETTPAPAQVAPESSINQQQPQSQQTALTITVSTPPANASVTSPLVVTGKANATTVTLDLKDNKGNILSTKTVGVSTATAGQQGDFNTTLTFVPQPQAVNGSLDVYSKGTNGAKNGLVTIPLILR